MLASFLRGDFLILISIYGRHCFKQRVKKHWYLPLVTDTEEHEWLVTCVYPLPHRPCSPAPSRGHAFLNRALFSAGTFFSLADLHYHRANNAWQQCWVNHWVGRESLFNCTESKVFGRLSFCSLVWSVFRGWWARIRTPRGQRSWPPLSQRITTDLAPRYTSRAHQCVCQTHFFFFSLRAIFLRALKSGQIWAGRLWYENVVVLFNVLYIYI